MADGGLARLNQRGATRQRRPNAVARQAHTGSLVREGSLPLQHDIIPPFFIFNSLSAYCHIPSQINLATTRRRGPTITFQSWYAHALVDIHAHAFPVNANTHFTTSSRRWRAVDCLLLYRWYCESMFFMWAVESWRAWLLMCCPHCSVLLCSSSFRVFLFPC